LPAGYFHGLVAKYVAGELHLERTASALRRAVEPVRYPDRKDRSHRRDVQRDWIATMSVLAAECSSAPGDRTRA
jgi:hypothetical protein